MKTLSAAFFLLIIAFASLAQERILRIGINFMSPPFCFVNAEGDTVGVDREIALQIAKELNATPKFVLISGAAYRQTALDSAEVDLIIAAFSITKDRAKKVWLSHPYYYAKQGLGVLAASGKGIANLYDLEGKRYGFVLGSTSDTYVTNALKWNIKKGGGGPGIGIGVPDQEQLMRMFFNGEFDAVVDDIALVKYWDEHSSDHEIVPSDALKSPADSYGVAASKTFKDTAAINKVIDRLVPKAPGEDLVKKSMAKYNTVKPAEFIAEKNYAVILGIMVIPLLVILYLIWGNRKKSIKVAERCVIESDEPINYCWIIANSDYQDQQPLNDHPYKDAERLRDALLKYGFQPEDIAIQCDATRKTLVTTFQDLASRGKNQEVPFASILRPIDNLVIYYTGHGHMQRLGSSSIGFWIPIDGAEPWELIPDYEIKFFLNLMNLNQILLISDSCFAGSLIDSVFDGADLKTDVFNRQRCIEILASGNNRVPDNSEFLTELISVLEGNPQQTLLSHKLYEQLQMKLRNNRYYQPQFGSFYKMNDGACFHFVKPLATQPIVQPSLMEKLKKSIVDFFTVEETRIVSFVILKEKTGVPEPTFLLALQELIDENVVCLTDDNAVFRIK